MLKNTLYQLHRKKSLRIAYFGGSITEGGGDYGWRRQTTKWFEARYPSAHITEINAAIGGTGTDLGVFRCEKDVIAFSPDLTFIEFAVNDSITDPEQLSRTTEAIVRKLLTSNPLMDIIFAFTMTKKLYTDLKKGIPFFSRDRHSAIAAHYHLPTIDMGTPLAEAAAAENDNWLIFTKDNVHPNQIGYAVMTPIMLDALSALLNAPVPDQPSAHVIPDPLYDNLPMSARLADALPLTDDYAPPAPSHECGWSRLPMTLCSRYPTVIGTNKPGAELIFHFDVALDHSPLGIYWMMASDSGDIDYRIDNGDWQHISSYDEYCARFDRANFHFLAQDLSAGSHTLTLRVSTQKNSASHGHWVRIGAFGIC